MKSMKSRRETAEKPQRIMFFDIFRIICVAFIVYNHFRFNLFGTENRWYMVLFMNGYLPFNIYPLSAGVLAVYGMIFISGAVIQYNYKRLKNASEYTKFLFRRFVRLYPAFWMSLILGIRLFPAILKMNIPAILFEFTGYFVFLGTGSGNINQMGWFIGTIFSLYILFPFLSEIVRKYRIYAVLAFMIISYASRSILLTYNPIPLYDIVLWLPVCNLFEFCLGIYCVQANFYPALPNNSPVIRQLSELSFYVFLFHVIIMNYYFDMFPQVPEFRTMFVLYYVLLFIILVVSYLAMVIDRNLQKIILDYARTKN